MLNAKEIQEKLAAEQGRAALLATDKTRTDEEKVRELYYWVYAREPDADELKLAQSYLDKKIKAKNEKETTAGRRQAYEDILWALINTKEFLFNH